jgi:2-iminobutanoate/2-iminopropanoate deaminase
MFETIYSPEAPEPVGPYSQAIRRGDMVFCSGQVAIDRSSGTLRGGNASEQARQALHNLGAVLAAAGLSLANVVKTTIFLVDMRDFAAVNAVYGEHFSGAAPARSTVAVAGLPLGALVEIEALAFAD